IIIVMTNVHNKQITNNLPEANYLSEANNLPEANYLPEANIIYESTDDDDIDLEYFFQKAYYGGMDIETFHKNIEVVIIKKEQSFNSFEQAESHIKK
ncbi:16823_t:CDS:1, partial [Racocetra persica]